MTRSPESDPNARGRVRGIALLCVHMKNHHTSQREQIAMQLNQVANQFRFSGAKLQCNFKKVNYSLGCVVCVLPWSWEERGKDYSQVETSLSSSVMSCWVEPWVW